MPDDSTLFQPSVQDSRTAVPPKGKRPWRSGAITMVGFFGGSLAATMFALANRRRLDDPEPGLHDRLALAGALFTVVQVGGVIAAMLLVDYADNDNRRIIRLGGRLFGMGCGWWMSRALAGAERRYLLRTGAEEESAFDGAFLPGLWATVLWGLLGALPAAVTYAMVSAE